MKRATPHTPVPRPQTPSSRAHTLPKLLTYLLLLTLSILFLIPFAYLLCSSLKSPQDFFTSLFLPTDNGKIAWSHLTLDNFHRVLAQPDFPRALLNSFFYASVTAVSGLGSVVVFQPSSSPDFSHA